MHSDAQALASRCRDEMWSTDFASQHLGIVVDVTKPGVSMATLKVRKEMVNGHGICHGGYIFTLADTAFAFACNTYDRITVAAGATIDFLRPGMEGDLLTARATEINRGRTNGLYDVCVTNQDGKVIAQFRGRSHATSDVILKSDT